MTNSTGSDASAVREYVERVTAERAKATEKYGAVALLPGGHPDYDVLDFLINEVVGLLRYGEMLRHRITELDENGDIAAIAFAYGMVLSETVARFSTEAGVGLIALRQRLKLGGVELGLTEADMRSRKTPNATTVSAMQEARAVDPAKPGSEFSMMLYPESFKRITRKHVTFMNNEALATHRSGNSPHGETLSEIGAALRDIVAARGDVDGAGERA